MVVATGNLYLKKFYCLVQRVGWNLNLRPTVNPSSALAVALHYRPGEYSATRTHYDEFVSEEFNMVYTSRFYTYIIIYLSVLNN